MFVFQKFLLPILVCWKIGESTGLVSIPSRNRIPASTTMMNIRLFAVESSEENDSEETESESESPSLAPQEPSLEMDTSTMTIKDGNDTSDRFNYKVHALMGDYDPTEGMPDDEDQDGNIMKALLTFPTQHVFDVVGRLSSATTNDDYAEKVKTIVFDTTGDDDMECEVIPRGKKFVKVRCTANVESTTMINTIYDELGKMESTVMKF